MNKILIADAGATKVEWLLVNPAEAPEKALRHTTTGINAAMTPDEEITAVLNDVRSREGWSADQIGNIVYYGAGCIGGSVNSRIEFKLHTAFPNVEVDIQSDLVGAARALHGRNPGVACILGTGSNSCLYDGKEVCSNVPSLGYILGDEGSGTALGKRLIADVFKKELPRNMSEKFLEYIGMTLPEIIEQVYRRPNANRFLASVVPFIKENLWNPYIYSLVLKEMTSFLKRNVSKYENARRLPIGFVGSIAWHFKEQLKDATEANGFTIGEILKSPGDRLVQYHLGK